MTARRPLRMMINMTINAESVPYTSGVPGWIQQFSHPDAGTFLHLSYLTLQLSDGTD